MITDKSSFFQLTLSAITFVLALGALAMIWPSIIALFLSVILLFQSCSAGQEQEIAGLLWTEIGHVPIVFTS
ncbi:MAG: hypothetical protein HC801_13795 [Nitrospira sp.]|nr:hypothetical protein [Nitrospira sp.]